MTVFADGRAVFKGHHRPRNRSFALRTLYWCIVIFLGLPPTFFAVQFKVAVVKKAISNDSFCPVSTSVHLVLEILEALKL